MSMLSAQRDELCKCADALQDAIDNLNLVHITYEGLTDAMHYGINDLRYAADTIWELRNKMCDMVDARERARVLESENDRLRELIIDFHLTADEFSEKYERPFYVDKFLFRRDHINDRMRGLGIEVSE